MDAPESELSSSNVKIKGDTVQDETTAPIPDVTPDETPDVETSEVVETEDVQQETPDQETTVEQPDAPTEEAPAEEPEEDEVYEEIQIPELPRIDLTKVPMDAEGNLDPNALLQQIELQNRAAVEQAVAITRAEMQQQAREEKLWNKAVDKYPDLKSNRELRDLVHKSRVGSIIEGKNPTPLEVADTLFKHLGQQEIKGAKNATESVRVQRSATLETSSRSSANNLTKSQQLLSQIKSPDRDTAERARQEYLRTQLFGED